MTVIARKDRGEQILANIKASSMFGEGSLCITTHAVAYEVRHKGIYLNFIPHGIITKFNMCGSGMFGTRRCQIRWTENGSEHTFEFRTRQYRQIQAMRDRFWSNS